MLMQLQRAGRDARRGVQASRAPQPAAACAAGEVLVQIALCNGDVSAAPLNDGRYADAATDYSTDHDLTRPGGRGNTGQSGGTAGADASAPEAWSATSDDFENENPATTERRLNARPSAAGGPHLLPV